MNTMRCHTAFEPNVRPLTAAHRLCTPFGGQLPWRRSSSRQHTLLAYQQTEYISGSSSSSNLGVLQQVVEQDTGAADDPYGMQRVSVDSFSGRGFYLEGGSIISSLVLLLVLLALTFQRILGLDRFISRALQEWKDARVLQRRAEALKAKEVLEDLWDKDSKQQ